MEETKQAQEKEIITDPNVSRAEKRLESLKNVGASERLIKAQEQNIREAQARAKGINPASIRGIDVYKVTREYKEVETEQKVKDSPASYYVEDRLKGQSRELTEEEYKQLTKKQQVSVSPGYEEKESTPYFSALRYYKKTDEETKKIAEIPFTYITKEKSSYDNPLLKPSIATVIEVQKGNVILETLKEEQKPLTKTEQLISTKLSQQNYKELQKKIKENPNYTGASGLQSLNPFGEGKYSPRMIESIKKGLSYEDYIRRETTRLKFISGVGISAVAGYGFGYVATGLKSIGPLVSTGVTAGEGVLIGSYASKTYSAYKLAPGQKAKGEFIAGTSLNLISFGVGAKIGGSSFKQSKAIGNIPLSQKLRLFKVKLKSNLGVNVYKSSYPIDKSYNFKGKTEELFIPINKVIVTNEGQIIETISAKKYPGFVVPIRGKVLGNEIDIDVSYAKGLGERQSQLYPKEYDPLYSQKSDIIVDKPLFYESALKDPYQLKFKDLNLLGDQSVKILLKETKVGIDTIQYELWPKGKGARASLLETEQSIDYFRLARKRIVNKVQNVYNKEIQSYNKEILKSKNESLLLNVYFNKYKLDNTFFYSNKSISNNLYAVGKISKFNTNAIIKPSLMDETIQTNKLDIAENLADISKIKTVQSLKQDQIQEQILEKSRSIQLLSYSKVSYNKFKPESHSKPSFKGKFRLNPTSSLIIPFKEKKKRKDEYLVFVKRFGKDVIIGKSKDISSAKSLLRYTLESSARASGYLEKDRQKIYTDLGQGFRRSKKDSFRSVQKRGFRIRSAGELREITYKGLSSRPNKRRLFR